MTQLDLDAIRRDARDGLPVLPMTVLALVEQIEYESNNASYWYRRLEAISNAARAYFAAVDTCNGIVAAEQSLREAVEGR